MKTPRRYASFETIDAWLTDRGWMPEDSRKSIWRKHHGRRLLIRTYEEAQSFQRRSDARRAA